MKNNRQAKEKNQIESENEIQKTFFEKKLHKTIEERFKDYDGNYKPEEVDWGESVGREIW
jgi:antitoxin MazE